MIDKLVLGGLNHLLRQASWARKQLQPFAARQARFDMPPWQLAFAVTGEGLFEPVAEGDIDVTITLPANAPLLALQGVDRAMAAAHVAGNAEFATALSFVFKNLRWDAEEDLSKLVGDIAAHRLTELGGRVAQWQKDAARNATENIAEYLSEEARLVVSKRELAGFAQTLAALEQRIADLEGRLARIAR